MNKFNLCFVSRNSHNNNSKTVTVTVNSPNIYIFIFVGYFHLDLIIIVRIASKLSNPFNLYINTLCALVINCQWCNHNTSIYLICSFFVSFFLCFFFACFFFCSFISFFYIYLIKFLLLRLPKKEFFSWMCIYNAVCKWYGMALYSLL